MWVRVFLTSFLILPSVIHGIDTEQEEEGASSSDFYQCVPGVGNNPGGGYNNTITKMSFRIFDNNLTHVTSVGSASKIS